MQIFSVFIFLILLENLLLPALVGPGQFLGVQVFILGAVAYSKNWKIMAWWVLTMVLIKEFVSGIEIGFLLPVFVITSVLYLLLNKFLSIRDDLLENRSVSGAFVSISVLIILNSIYSWLFILHYVSAYNFEMAWNYWLEIFKGSLINILGWSVSISVLFKYVFKTK